ncbi:hypothetical protein ACFV0O_26370 [Kitasatospora sp. NPDC059577]|uniref:hypothetical protein n=1 Tax=Kitasatospora sp. NPDC059577 TaxID=3346873 RepID=UPI0036A9C67F
MGLQNLVDGLPDAFAAAPRPTVIDACPCCTPQVAIDTLLRTPRERLGPEDLTRYAASVLNTVGSPADLRYFTPRILQLLLAGELTLPDLEPFCLKLARAGWSDWPEAPYLRQLLDALWSDVLTGPAWWDAEAVLCALAAADPAGTDGRLAAWERLATATAVDRLHEFLLDSGGRPRNAFWDRGGAAHLAFTAWLRGPALRRAVEEAIDRTDGSGPLEQLFTVHDVLVTTAPPGPAGS